MEIATNIAVKITCKNENTAEDIVVSPCDTNNQNAPVNEIWHNESMKRKHLNANKSDNKNDFVHILWCFQYKVDIISLIITGVKLTRNFQESTFDPTSFSRIKIVECQSCLKS